MGGIADVVETEGTPSREPLERMGQSIAHGGPDDGRIETFGRAGSLARKHPPASAIDPPKMG